MNVVPAKCLSIIRSGLHLAEPKRQLAQNQLEPSNKKKLNIRFFTLWLLELKISTNSDSIWTKEGP